MRIYLRMLVAFDPHVYQLQCFFINLVIVMRGRNQRQSAGQSSLKSKGMRIPEQIHMTLKTYLINEVCIS